MKTTNTFLAVALIVISGCGGNKQSADDFITVDVTAGYPEKELILQDFMDVEYVPLETTDKFVTQAFVLDVGKDIIVAKNNPEMDKGDIYLFDRTGKGVRTINRRGPGAEEYRFAYGVTLDEDNGELFVNDMATLKIAVYDLYGNFKRSFRQWEGAMYDKVHNFDRDHLICSDGNFNDNGEVNRITFAIVSKQDGSVVRYIPIPFKDTKSPMITLKDDEGRMIMSGSPFYVPIIPFRNSWALTSTSSDTVFLYSPDNSLKPVIVRIPSIQTMQQEIYLFPSVFTERYSFMAAVKKEYDFEKRRGYPGTPLAYDSQEKKIYECTVTNGDFSGKTVNMEKETFNNETAFCVKYEADELVEALEKGRLKSRLKEIAAGLEEESNPVLMLVKYKKK
jgi:hypothetical protein